MPVGEKPLAYNSLWQLRNDTWSSLEEATTQLALAAAQQRPVEQLAERVTRRLDILGSIERFWAFPGRQTYQEVQRLFAAGKYERLAARGGPGQPGIGHRVLPRWSGLGSARRG